MSALSFLGLFDETGELTTSPLFDRDVCPLSPTAGPSLFDTEFDSSHLVQSSIPITEHENLAQVSSEFGTKQLASYGFTTVEGELSDGGNFTTQSTHGCGVPSSGTCSTDGGSISAFTLNSGGSGYAVNDLLGVLDLTGTGAVLKVTAVSGTVITGLSIINGGQLYGHNFDALTNISSSGSGGQITITTTGVGVASDFFTGQSWPDNQYSEVTLLLQTGNFGAIVVCVRASGSANNLYVLAIRGSLGVPQSIVIGTGMVVGNSISRGPILSFLATPNVGDRWRISVVGYDSSGGPILTATQFPVGGGASNSWSCQDISSSGINSGYPGFALARGSDVSEISAWAAGGVGLGTSVQESLASPSSTAAAKHESLLPVTESRVAEHESCGLEAVATGLSKQESLQQISDSLASKHESVAPIQQSRVGVHESLLSLATSKVKEHESLLQITEPAIAEQESKRSLPVRAAVMRSRSKASHRLWHQMKNL